MPEGVLELKYRAHGFVCDPLWVRVLFSEADPEIRARG
jgi:hypothetical protein